MGLVQPRAVVPQACLGSAKSIPLASPDGGQPHVHKRSSVTLRVIEGGTRLTNAEEFRGLMVPMFWGKMNMFVGPMLESMNNALKARLEATS